MEQVEKISDNQLKITNEVIEYIEKKDLEGQKSALETRLIKVNARLDIFKELK